MIPGLFAILLGFSHAQPSDSPPPQEIAWGRRALEILSDHMRDQDFEIRAAAAASWGAIGNRAAIPGLKKALSDKTLAVRIEAAHSLHRLGDPLGQKTLEDIARRAPKLATGPESPIEQMRRLARNKARTRAIEVLSGFGGERAVAVFEPLLEDSSGAVRDAVAVALAKMGFSEFSAQFLEALKNPDESVRGAAVRALGKIGGPEVLDAVSQAAVDSSVAVRVEAMKALEAFSGLESQVLLSKGAKDEDARVRSAALSTMARLGEPGNIGLLKEILKESKAPEIQLKALAGLARRGQEVELDLAEDALNHKDLDLKLLALDLLRAVNNPLSSRFLAQFMENSAEPRVKVEAASILVARLQRRKEP